MSRCCSPAPVSPAPRLLVSHQHRCRGGEGSARWGVPGPVPPGPRGTMRRSAVRPAAVSCGVGSGSPGQRSVLLAALVPTSPSSQVRDCQRGHVSAENGA